MDERRAYLKQLASRAARRGSSAPLPPCFSGEKQVETRNTVYRLRDGVCHWATRRTETPGLGGNSLSPELPADSSRTVLPASKIFGMRLIGWVASDEPGPRIALEWTRGVRAVFWRPRHGVERHSVVALTSATLRFGPCDLTCQA
jgi:hypothetical protein